MGEAFSFIFTLSQTKISKCLFISLSLLIKRAYNETCKRFKTYFWYQPTDQSTNHTRCVETEEIHIHCFFFLA